MHGVNPPKPITQNKRLRRSEINTMTMKFPISFVGEVLWHVSVQQKRDSQKEFNSILLTLVLSVDINQAIFIIKLRKRQGRSMEMGEKKRGFMSHS